MTSEQFIGAGFPARHSSLVTRHQFFLPRPERHGGVHLGLVLLSANSRLAEVNVLAPAAAG